MPKMAQKQIHQASELISSVHFAESKVYFRMRHNRRLRKTRLLVSPEEGLVVESPRILDVEHAHRTITRRKTWVLNALESVKAKHELAQKFKKHRNSILVFGHEKQVEIRVAQKRDYILERKNLIVLGFTKSRATKQEAEAKLTDWLTQKAKAYLPLRVRQLNRGRFEIKDVFVKNQKTIWGSCSSQGNINLNWRIIMAPKAMSDYIIYHELAHTRFMDHSEKFWKVVSEVCPKYEEMETWFQKFGFVLHINLLHNFSF